ncbi:hypothetical protein OMAG_002586, partial [Candidatus Omnitrophus magneticus]
MKIVKVVREKFFKVILKIVSNLEINLNNVIKEIFGITKIAQCAKGRCVMKIVKVVREKFFTVILKIVSNLEINLGNVVMGIFKVTNTPKMGKGRAVIMKNLMKQNFVKSIIASIMV